MSFAVLTAVKMSTVVSFLGLVRAVSQAKNHHRYGI